MHSFAVVAVAVRKCANSTPSLEGLNHLRLYGGLEKTGGCKLGEKRGGGLENAHSGETFTTMRLFCPW